MDMDGQLSIDEEVQHKEKKESGFYCTACQIFCAILVALVIAAITGVLAFYLPVRTCSDKSVIEDSNQPTMTPTVPMIRTGTRKPNLTLVPAPTEEPWMGRLPTNVWPLRYDLTLTPYLYPEDVINIPNRRRFTFDGQVNIRVRVQQVTDVITLHINNITIYVLKVTSMADPTETNLVVNWSIDEYYQFLHIQLSEDLRIGPNYEISIEYLGYLWDGLAGFYRSSYTNEKGEEK